MLPTFQAAASDLKAIRETLASTWGQGRWFLLPVVSGIALFIALRRLVLILPGLVGDLVAARRNAKEAERRRKLDEAKDIYPLW